jgi:restriction system protein
MSVYIVRADYGKFTNQFKELGVAAIGWFNNHDTIPNSRAEIELFYDKEYPNHKKMQKAVNIGQINRFIFEIKKGDIILCPFDNEMLLVGEVVSDVYVKKLSGIPWNYIREVKWHQEPINRQNFSVPLQNTLRSMQTVYRVKQEGEVLKAIGKKVEEAPIVATAIELDHLFDKIKERLLELDADEFELLVSYVLQSLGFEARQRQGKAGDGGIDFEGVLNVMGVAKIQLQVQVKRYEQASIGELDIRNLRGALKSGHQGCFITLSSFQRRAIASAGDPEKTPISIIDGRRFIEIFTEQYEKIMDLLLEEDQEELASKIKFRKGLWPE